MPGDDSFATTGLQVLKLLTVLLCCQFNQSVICLFCHAHLHLISILGMLGQSQAMFGPYVTILVGILGRHSLC